MDMYVLADWTRDPFLKSISLFGFKKNIPLIITKTGTDQRTNESYILNICQLYSLIGDSYHFDAETCKTITANVAMILNKSS